MTLKRRGVPGVPFALLALAFLSPRAGLAQTPAAATRLAPASSATPAPGAIAGTSGINAIPNATPAGGPPYRSTPMTPGSGARRPNSAADCRGDAWRSYAGLGFTSQGNCEAWLRHHPTAPAARGRARTAARTPAPGAPPPSPPGSRPTVSPARS